MHAHRQLVRCRGCGHGWLESSAFDVSDVVAGLDPSGHPLLDDPAIEDDAVAIARASARLPNATPLPAGAAAPSFAAGRSSPLSLPCRSPC